MTKKISTLFKNLLTKLSDAEKESNPALPRQTLKVQMALRKLQECQKQASSNKG